MITALPPAPLVSTSGGLFSSTGSGLTLSQTATEVAITPSLGSGISIPAATDSLAGVLDANRASAIDNLATVASSGKYSDLTDIPDRSAFITLIIDGGGAAISAPIIRYLYIPFAAVITGWVLMADQVGDISVDVWKEASSGYPPLVVNSITGGSPMLLDGAAFGLSLTAPSAWTTTEIEAGDCLAFNVSSAATIQAVTAQLIITH